MPINPPGPQNHIYRPSELNSEVRIHLEAGFPRVWLQAEISNLARPASGHMYFTLKDRNAQIRCALFRGNAQGLGFRPSNGQEVLVRGRLGLYEPRGEFQLIADGLLEAGAGALQQAFEALKRKLDQEGLFAAERKQALPRWPRRISVITSPSGAAVRDIVTVLGRRWPSAAIRIYPCQVQGEAAPAELLRALQAADRHGYGDIIIIGRGGGSLEDLWAFNDEALARAIAAARTPLISAVGHETDFTIADFVADERAPTPSAAAVAATPDGTVLAEQLRRLDRQLLRSTRAALERRAQQVDYLGRRLVTHQPSRRIEDGERRARQLDERLLRATRRGLDERQQRSATLAQRLGARHPDRRIQRYDDALTQSYRRLVRAGQRSLEQASDRLGAASRALNSVSPLNVLQRGYAVVRAPDGTALSRPEQLPSGRSVNLMFSDFEVDAEIVSDPRHRNNDGNTRSG
jgi:exodeoxyribonuclease VII large subunit